MIASRRKGWGLGPFLPLRVSTQPLWGRIHYLRICSVLRSGNAEERVEKQMSSQTRSSLSSPPPPVSDFHSPSLSSPRPSPLPARPLSYFFLRRRSGSFQRVPGLGKDLLTWPSLHWGSRPRLPGRPQLRQAPRGPGPSGHVLRF